MQCPADGPISITMIFGMRRSALIFGFLPLDFQDVRHPAVNHRFGFQSVFAVLGCVFHAHQEYQSSLCEGWPFLGISPFAMHQAAK